MHTDESASDVSGSKSDCSTDIHTAASTPGASSPAQQRAALIGTIEGEIVPRLLMLRRTRGTRHAQDSRGDGATDGRLEPGDVAEFARLLLAHGPSMGCEFVATMRQQGTPYDRICLDLIAPAARRLVELWEQHDCGYSELTLGLNALHAVLLEVSAAARSDRHVSHGV